MHPWPLQCPYKQGLTTSRSHLVSLAVLRRFSQPAVSMDIEKPVKSGLFYMPLKPFENDFKMPLSRVTRPLWSDRE